MAPAQLVVCLRGGHHVTTFCAMFVAPEVWANMRKEIGADRKHFVRGDLPVVVSEFRREQRKAGHRSFPTEAGYLQGGAKH